MFQFKVQSENASAKSKSDTSICSESSTDSSLSGENINQYSIGNRIKCDDHFGIIRYIGPVEPHPGIWFGIEWDDPSRGRHDGTVNGVTYFKSSKPNAASFVRPPKVKKVKNIFEAIHERYGFDPDAIRSLTDIGGGLERRKIDYSHLKIVDVSSRQISDLGKPGELAELAPNIERLYIADNLFTEWQAIGDLCKGLTRLKLLDISENALQPVPEKLSDTLETVFQNLEHVIMSKINCDWNEVMKSSYMWINLANLQVPYNKISLISLPQETLLNLTSLDLGGNHISSWDEVLKLSVLKKLEYLNLCGNRIGNIRFPFEISTERSSENKKTSIFPNLSRLNLSENCIPDWTSINELNKLPELKELRIDTNPFLDNDTRANNREMVIARMNKLQKLDGAEILRQERRDSELDYIKKFATLYASEGTTEKFAIEHPRYPELVKLFGQSEVGESENALKSMKTCLINLEIVPEDESRPPIQKKLLATMTVQKLKMLLQRLLKLPGKPIEINVVSGRNSDIKWKLDNDFFELSQYSLEDGDKLLLKW